MSTVLQPQSTDRATKISPESHPLTAVLDDRYALKWQHCVVCLWFVMTFLFVSHAPLFHSEVWRHAAVGRTMLQTGQIPTSPLRVPLADGMPYLDSAWLSQWTMGLVIAKLGIGRLSSLSAILVVATLMLWANGLYRVSGQKRFMLAGVSFIAWLGVSEMTAPQPLLFGGLCMALLAWLVLPVMSAQQPLFTKRIGWRPVSIVLVMMAWANLDGSFVFGWGMLLALAVGVACKVWSEQRGAGRFLEQVAQTAQSTELRSWVWLTEVALLATFFNPHGLRIWSAALGRGGSFPLWAEAGGQLPLVLASVQGLFFASVVGIVMFCWTQSRLKISHSEVFLGLASGCLAAWSTRFLPWFVGVALILIGRHYRDVAQQRGWLALRNDRAKTNAQDADAAREGPQPLKFAYSMIAALIVWCGFALSPISAPLLGGQARSLDKLHHQGTPLGVASYLREHGAKNLVWAPNYWADWLIYDGGDDRQYFTDSHLNQLPGMVQRDYSQLFLGGNNWQRIADRYAIHTLIIDKQQQPRMASEVMRSRGKWRLAMENSEALVLNRVGI